MNTRMLITMEGEKSNMDGGDGERGDGGDGAQRRYLTVLVGRCLLVRPAKLRSQAD